MMSIDTPTSLPDASWLIGMDNRLKHALRRADVAHLSVQSPDGLHRRAPTPCGGFAQLVTDWGPFESGNPRLKDRQCPVCRWVVAIDRDGADAELKAIAPADDEMPALSRILEQPLMAVAVCKAILANTSEDDGDYELDHPHIAHLLGHATAHAPTLVVPEECADGCCDHRPADRWDDATWQCEYPDADAACGACSIRAGGYAGEWEGQFSPECFVTAPCSVLTSFARHYGIALGSRRSPTESLAGQPEPVHQHGNFLGEGGGDR